MKLNKKILAAAILAIGATASSYAAVVTAGTSTVPTFSATDFGGTLLNSVTTYINTPSYNGNVRAAVYDVGTGLDFYYQYENLANSKHGIERLATFDFTGFTVDAFETNAAFGIFTAGTRKASAVNRDLTDGVVGTNYLPDGLGKIDPGVTSYTVILRTNAHAYTQGSLAVIDGFAANGAAFAPTAVPEPETYAMILAGLGLLGAARRIKQQKLG